MDQATNTTRERRGGALLGADWRQALRAPMVLGLAALLILQIGLAVLLGQDGTLTPTTGSAPLLDLDIALVDRIEVESGAEEADPSPVRLERDGEAWLLPALDGFPVSATRVQQVLDDLDGLTRPLPVATSREAQRRFRVADDAFERRLTLGAGADEVTLIIGDSPGFRRLFARVDGEEMVYDLRLGLFDLGTSADDWIDRGRLQFDRGEIERVAVQDRAGEPWALVRAEDGWSLEGSDDDIDQEMAASLIGAVATVSYNSVLLADGGGDSAPGYDLGDPDRTLTIERDGETRRYAVASIEDSEDFVLGHDGEPYVYRIGAFDAELLLEATRDGLLGVEEAVEPAPETGDGSGERAEAGVDLSDETSEPTPMEIPAAESVPLPEPAQSDAEPDAIPTADSP
jgi:hypothetical protein